MSGKETAKIEYLDSLRTLAMFGVVLIHVSTPLVNMMWGKNVPYWWVGNVADSLVRFAVPLFLMLSGATLFGKHYSLGNFYRRRFLRVFVPFVFWLVVYWVYRWAILKDSVRPDGFTDILNWAMRLFLNEGVSKHFWYIYMILFVYLFVPFAGRFFQGLKVRTLVVFVLAWLVLLIFTRTLPFNAYSWSGDYVSKFFGYFLHSGYLLLGYLLVRIDNPFQNRRIIPALIFTSTVLIVSVGTFWVSRSKLNLSMYAYLSMTTVIQSMALFLWIKDLNVKNKIVKKVQTLISDYSYGIYLVHMLVIGLLFRAGIYWSFTVPIISLPLLVVGVTLISFAIIFILRKIPVIKYMAG